MWNRPEQAHRLGELAEVVVENRLVELARVVRGAGRADRRIVRRRRPGLESPPCHPQPYDIEPEPGHERRVGGREVPGFARCRVQLEGGSLYTAFDTVEEHDTALLVLEKRPAWRADWTLDGRRPSNGRWLLDGPGETGQIRRGRAGAAG